MGFSGDPNLGWTCKSALALQPENTSAGQLFTAGQLPSEAAQEAAGIDPDAWLANGKITTVGSLTPAAPVITSASATRISDRTVRTDLTISNGGMPPAIVTWDFGDGTQVVERHHPPYQCSHVYAQRSASYTITATTKNQTGTDTDTTTIVVPALPTVTSATPLAGAAAGGTAITITGTGFSGGGHTVTIGGTTCTSIVVVNDTTITCASPAKAAGTYKLIVTTNGGAATNQPNFVYS